MRKKKSAWSVRNDGGAGMAGSVGKTTQETAAHGPEVFLPRDSHPPVRVTVSR